MAGKDNLVPLQEHSTEKQREIRSMGGIASGEAKRRKKAIRETVQAVAAMGVPDKALKALRQAGISEDDATYQTAIVLKMFHEAMSGNVAAFNAIVNASGEVVNKHEVTGRDGQPLTVEKQLSMSEIREKLRELDDE